MSHESSEFHARLRELLKVEEEPALTEFLADVRAADIAESFELLDDEERSRILFALPPSVAATVVVMLDEAVRGDVVDDLDAESLAEMVTALAPDDAADVLGELTDQEADEVLGHLAKARSYQLEGLLEHEEDTAGGIMTPDVVAVPAAASVGDAVEYVRRATQEEDLHEVYIVDDAHHPIGTVPLRRLVTSHAGTKLASIADSDPVVVSVGDDQETVVQIIRKYDVFEAGVVDAAGRLVGRITHDDVLDVADEEAEEDMLRMGGTDRAELESSSVLRAARVRFFWLSICMVGTLITALVLAIASPRFTAQLFATILLFVPLIGAMGGNSGIQVSTVVVRGFASGDYGSTRFWHVLSRESRIVLLLSLVCGCAAWLFARAMFPLLESVEGGHALVSPDRVAIAIGVALSVAIVLAGGLGVALPFAFRRIGVDPAIAAGPIVTTVNDIVAVSVYMILAMLIAR